jgi:hypothetical protein
MKLHLQINKKKRACNFKKMKQKRKRKRKENQLDVNGIGCDLPLLTRLNINSIQTRNKILDWNL